MSSHPRLPALVVALLIVAAACATEASPGTINLGRDGLSPGLDDVQVPADGDAIAGLDFTTLDGDGDSFDNHLGRPLVVNFFAAWCAPCRAELPDFQEAFAAYQDRVGFLGISRDDTPGPSIELLAEIGVTYPAGFDGRDGGLYPAVGGFGVMPMTLFVDEFGTVVDQWHGVLDGATLREKVEALL